MKAKWEVKDNSHHPAIRVKKQNNVAERQLENHISFMRQKCTNQTTKLEKSMKNLRRQLEHIDDEKSRSVDTTSGLGSRRVTSGYFMNRYSPTPESASSISSRQRHISCDFGSQSNNMERKCRYFPCTRPNSYHTIGFRIDPENTAWLPWKHVRRSLSDSALSAMGASVLLNTGVSRLRSERRSELLKLEMEQRRKRSEINRPPSWQVNYGKPTPYKIIKYPVKLDPLDM